eukprot:CAMPEP_0113939378 /NCGR_PEP_ID=MMETSP1339-20121228/5706_1 /TAXON_ID=94617 /ORGANISM="Fibrocapsa japonica" /LENGTH=189 /DNA_ID=CAMNT_0000942869 /DNA_START=1 /DNA_END=566 /DNA_ORIENTATION=- /assembly_acc=CAM_ASM_000762
MAMDIGHNCSAEYDDWMTPYGGGEMPLVAMFGLQIIFQLVAFLTLFLMMGDTYLVRVGLLGVLYTKFKTVFILHVIYTFFTMMLGGYRLYQIVELKVAIYQIWDVWAYTEMSFLHKILAALYYVFTLRSAFQLTDPDLYSQDVWIDKYFQGISSTNVPQKPGVMGSPRASPRPPSPRAGGGPTADRARA